MSSDVVVLGGGNAALCAAITARENGASVTLLERAPFHMRGGNTRHTRDIRYAHDAPEHLTVGAYDDDEFLDDLVRVTGGDTDPDLARLVIRESHTLGDWMTARGVRWQAPLSGTLHLGRTNAFFRGGGKALLNTYYDAAARLGVEVRYGAAARELAIDRGRVQGVVAYLDGREERIACKAVVVAAGGFEANLEWLGRYWGEAAARFVVRGTPYNDGSLLAALYASGAKQIGDPKGFHAVAVDARAPQFDGGIVTRIDAIPFGVAVNKNGERFYDEG
ncbi:MAG: FAD-dependent tricarballylate dehydrogenase TcuA, partial [Candidatus Eremiobacteraeota bacterium]|nr:FAD-dependent tricarballylate dehydrogenase TcuA [Candidatus Eremiobacteraeota bacterium]